MLPCGVLIDKIAGQYPPVHQSHASKGSPTWPPLQHPQRYELRQSPTETGLPLEREHQTGEFWRATSDFGQHEA